MIVSVRRLLSGLIAVAVLASLVALAGVPSAQAGKGKSPFTHFGELTQDSEHLTGFFDLYTKREDIYLEIPVDRLDEPFLLIQTLARGIGMRGLNGGTSMNIFEADLLQFERRGDRVFLVELNTHFRAPEGTAMANAVDFSHGNSVIASFKIESERRDGDEVGVVPEEPKKDGKEASDAPEDSTEASEADAGEDDPEKADEPEEEAEEPEEPEKPVVSLVVKFSDFILSDVANLGTGLSETFKTGFSLDGSRSAVRSVKVFPENAEFSVDLTFKSSGKEDVASIPDSRYLPLGMHYSFSKLPEEPMLPRLADDRVGYFMTVHKDYAKDRDPDYFTRYINKWRLEKKNPNRDVSEPVKPIVYYLDHSIPEEYRKYMKEGVEMWQAAFEEAGFRNAIVAKDAPDDPDYAPEDVRYSTLRWITSHQPVYGAIGPSRVDPRTGEILDSDILFESSMVQGFRYSWRSYVGAGGEETDEEGLLPWLDPIGMQETAYAGAMRNPSAAQAPVMFCSLGHGFVASGELLRATLAADGAIRPGEPVPMEYVGEALKWVTAHEVGHALGLRHNFKSSKSVPYDKLHDRSYVKENGLYGSVMEYPTVNIAPEGVKQGYFYTPVVGTYDRWAIRYGYTPVKGAKEPGDETKTLARIAAESVDPLHAYGPDEDSYLPGATDPFTTIFDLGGDPLAWAEDRANHVTGIWKNGLEDRVMADGDPYSNIRDNLGVMFGQYSSAMTIVSRHIGGKHAHRDRRGDPGARPPFVAVAASEQRRALGILAEHLFSEDPFRMPASFYERIGADNYNHWGNSITSGGRRDFPVHQAVLSVQRGALNRLTNTFTLEKVVDGELQQDDPFTLVELFGTLNAAIWSEVGAEPLTARAGNAGAGGVRSEARNIPSFRRGLQRMWLDRLIDVSMSTKLGPMADARAVARMALTDLRQKIEAALDGGADLDGYTRAHLMDSGGLIAKALEAGYEVELMNTRR